MTQIAHPTTTTAASAPPILDILILGTGWTTATYILPLLHTQHLTHATTTRTGRPSTIPFTFDPSSHSLEPYRRLPLAKTVLITFPLKGKRASGLLVGRYERTHGKQQEEGGRELGEGEGEGEEQWDKEEGRMKDSKTQWIQLGSTGIYTSPHWNDSTSPYDTANERAVAEDELLSLLGANACVLNLAGLYGGDRQPRNWVGRVAKSKADVKGKGALHLVHGRDVARAVVGVMGALGWEGVGGRRWIVCDLRVYDWWNLIMSWGEGEGEGMEGMEYRRWVFELMREGDVRALPREKEALGRILDGRSFWEAIGTWPGAKDATMELT